VNRRANIAAMETDGWGRELAALGATGYRCIRDNDDGDLPTAIFGKVEDGMLYLIHGMDFFLPNDDRRALVLPAEDFETFAGTVMGMLMESGITEEPRNE
jgi:hypothetical protein